MENKKALYILGGMGPGASNYFYKLLIDLAISKFGAKNNDDFPEIVLYSVPVPDFISDEKSKSKALEMLREKVKLINNDNALCISIACNTAHILLPKLQKVTKTPFVSMIEETAKKVHQDGKNRIGLLATPSTIKYGLYQEVLSQQRITTIIPSKQQIRKIEVIIRNVLKGKLFKKDNDNLKEIADDLINKGAEAIVLGCTELPLIFPKKFNLPVYNSLESLAEKLLQIYYEKEIQVLKGGESYERKK